MKSNRTAVELSHADPAMGLSPDTDKWKSKMSALKSRGFERVGAMREKMTGKVTSVRDGVTGRVAGANRNMRAHPAKWAGIAAGAGLGVGVLSRMLRARRRRQLPTLILIESC